MLFSLVFALACLVWIEADAAESPNGLRAAFVSKSNPSALDTVVLPNVWLYVPADASPTPFLKPGPFEVEWVGTLSTDLRGDYAFQAEVRGRVKVQVNGETVLETSSTNAGKMVRLSKGPNRLEVSFTSPEKGDAQLRLLWTPKGSYAVPLPLDALRYEMNDALRKSQEVYQGRELFLEHRCQRCHNEKIQGVPELLMDAPELEGIGSRRKAPWMAKWILDPRSLRPSAHMPGIFQGPDAQMKAADVAAYLGSADTTQAPGPKTPSEEEVGAGKQLFERLHCIACHTPPESEPADANLIPLNMVGAKFEASDLPAFLKNPQAHYAWVRMPRFKFTNAEPELLASYLLASSQKEGKPAQGNAERGKTLVQSSGCLSCHGSKLSNNFGGAPGLAGKNAAKGCLATERDQVGQAPWYAFSNAQRAALSAFLATDKSSLTRHVASEFAERQTRSSNCMECHGKFEGFPPFEILGDKLRPEWSATFIAGGVDYKPRPWLDARMPAFPARAALIADGLAMLHGLPPKTPEEGPLDGEAAKVGQKLVSPVGGFSCVMCHAAAEHGATQVFESAGINFAYGRDRLQKSYFQRWLRNPTSIDPATKMPLYFQEDGQSPLPDIYGGDGLKQIEAIWQYIRLGEKMPAPPTN